VALFSCTRTLMSIPFVSFPSSSFTEGSTGTTHDSLTTHHGLNLSLGALSQTNHLTQMPAQQHGESVSHVPSTQQLFHNWQCASETSNRMTVLYQQALQENMELQTKVWDLEAQLATQHLFKGNMYVLFLQSRFYLYWYYFLVALIIKVPPPSLTL